MNRINSFKEEHAFLSNFELCKVTLDGVDYPSVENAYQAAKLNIPNNLILTNIIRTDNGFDTCTAKQSKRLGRKVILRDDWDEIKDDIMYDLVKQKFSRNTKLKSMLMSTGDRELVEGNWWHDNYWGDCSCSKCYDIEGKNKLGKILMRVRDELKN